MTPPRTFRRSALFAIAAFAALAAPADEPGTAGRSRADAPPLVFRDVAGEAGLSPHLAGVRGHGAAWGDADGDGRLDLYVGTFATGGGKPNLFFRGAADGFRLDDQEAPRASTRATGVVFADLDADGDLDLYVASMPAPPGSKLAEREGRPLAGCRLFRNDGGGRFADVSEGNAACPPAFGGRGVAALDYDGDARLDLLVGEDPLPGYNGSPTKSSRLFRGLGGLRFEDATRAAGLPDDAPGLGVAAGDLNDDGRPDLFLASNAGNRLFLNAGDGTFREPPGGRETFAWPTAGGDDMVAGVCFGDVDLDGRLDVVVGQHYDHPWREPVANRLYLNRGATAGVPRFDDVTDAAGLVPLPMKAPHVEVQDFDDDGLPDLLTSVVKFAADGTPHPVIFRGVGVRGGVPRFEADALGANDFPTAADRAVGRSADLFAKVLRERTIFYAAPGPSGDYDGDGRLDLFLPSWWPEAPSLLLRNETRGGNRLDVAVAGGDGVNPMGIGSRVRVYEAGRLGDAGALIGCREIAVGYGYASGQPAVAHFGLGDREAVDVEVLLPHGKGRLVREGVTANRTVTISP